LINQHQITVFEDSSIKVEPDPSIFEAIRNRTNHPSGARADVIDDRAFKVDAEQLPRFINDVNMAAGDFEEQGEERLYQITLKLRDQLRELD
jgi:hypothetical protein